MRQARELLVTDIEKLNHQLLNGTKEKDDMIIKLEESNKIKNDYVSLKTEFNALKTATSKNEFEVNNESNLNTYCHDITILLQLYI